MINYFQRSMLHFSGLVVIVFVFNFSCKTNEDFQPKNDSGSYVIKGKKNYLNGYPAINPDGSVNVVVEIPAGSRDKWEVAKDEGDLRWEFSDGKPRVVNYLAYPGNYGMIPQTLLPKNLGGDGDPLDVIILGSAISRGDVVTAKIIGVLKLLDDGEQDDKLIAVRPIDQLGAVNNLSELKNKYPGITDILETWFTHYKGKGRIQSLGFDDVDKAKEILNEAAKAYQMVRSSK